MTPSFLAIDSLDTFVIDEEDCINEFEVDT